MIEQKKSSRKLPYDPKAYKVIGVEGMRIKAERKGTPGYCPKFCP